MKPTLDERFNGWTEQSLARYVAERDSAAGLPPSRGADIQPYVPGNVVTPFVRPKAETAIENCKRYNPHRGIVK